MLKKILLSFAIVSLTACSSASPKTKAVVASGVTGSAIGAGTGAIIGAAIANGDIAASALLGAGIGLPLGIAAGVAYADYLEGQEIQEGNGVIEANRDTIIQNQKNIDSLRLETDIESRTIDIDQSDSEYLYRGPSLPNRYRK